MDFQQRLRRRAASWRNGRRIVQMARQVARFAPKADGSQPPVAFFNATARLGGFTLNAAFDLLTSWSLRLAGAPAVHFACQAGMTHCVLGTDQGDLTKPPPCRACIAQSKRLYTASEVTWFRYSEEPNLAQSIRELSVEALCRFEYPLTAHSSQLIAPLPLGELVLPSVRWALRRHHLSDDEPTRQLLREYILSAYSLAAQFTKFLEAVRPQVVVLFNGILYPEATARWVTRQLGVRSVAFEVGFQPFSAFFTAGEPTAYPLQIPDEFELSAEQNAILDAHLEGRFQGKFSMAGIIFWPEMRALDRQFLEKAARYRQVVPIFTNVVYDSSQVHANTLFSNMFDWLDLLLSVIREHPETLFVIRAHPDEKRPVSNKISNESVHDWVYRLGVNQLPNVVFIEPDEFISSYELIQRAKFVLVYNSSIGLEAAILGAAVICGGRARYTQYPTVFLPESRAALENMVEQFLLTTVVAPPEFQHNARRFLYYQFYCASLPLDGFLQEGEKQGSVYLKLFSWQQLIPVVPNRPQAKSSSVFSQPGSSAHTLQILYDGILYEKPFVRS